MNGIRATWLRKRVVASKRNDAQYVAAKAWWKSLSHLQRKKFAHARDVQFAVSAWSLGRG